MRWGRRLKVTKRLLVKAERTVRKLPTGTEYEIFEYKEEFLK